MRKKISITVFVALRKCFYGTCEWILKSRADDNDDDGV